MPHICQFWYTTALYRLKKYTKKCVDLHQNNQNLPKYCVPYALKYTGLKKYTTTAVLTNISYDEKPSLVQLNYEAGLSKVIQH